MYDLFGRPEFFFVSDDTVSDNFRARAEYLTERNCTRVVVTERIVDGYFSRFVSLVTDAINNIVFGVIDGGGEQQDARAYATIGENASAARV